VLLGCSLRKGGAYCQFCRKVSVRGAMPFVSYLWQIVCRLVGVCQWHPAPLWMNRERTCSHSFKFPTPPLSGQRDGWEFASRAPRVALQCACSSGQKKMYSTVCQALKDNRETRLSMPVRPATGARCRATINAQGRHCIRQAAASVLTSWPATTFKPTEVWRLLPPQRPRDLELGDPELV